MKLFISWSGKLSLLIAKELCAWFPLVINQIEPFVSSENIKKGDRWSIEISNILNGADFGIVCLTKENLLSPWIMFEAGALSKNIIKGKVSCILFDGLTQNEVKSPLTIFQNTLFEKEDFKKILESINSALGDKKISNTLLNKAFEKWYPELEEKIKQIQQTYDPPKPEGGEGGNKINKLLEVTSYIANVVSRLNLNLPSESLDFVRFSDYNTIIYSGNDFNHPVKIYINPVFSKDGLLQEITITRKGTKISESLSQSDRGVLIEIVFYSENDVFWNIVFHFHKGNTDIKTNILNLEKEEAESLRHATIWRD